MSRLIETIRLTDGNFNNLEEHQERINRAFASLFPGYTPFRLTQAIGTDRPSNGIFKCRIVYDTVVRDLQFLEYKPAIIKTLRVVHDDSISYDHKFENRDNINHLFAQRETCDDVLIIKGGFVTDTSIANILFKRNNKWFTPASCLLRGTMREYLIRNKRLEVQEIREADIRKFDKFKLINSMILDSGPEREVSDIIE